MRDHINGRYKKSKCSMTTFSLQNSPDTIAHRPNAPYVSDTFYGNYEYPLHRSDLRLGIAKSELSNQCY